MFPLQRAGSTYNVTSDEVDVVKITICFLVPGEDVEVFG
jgi:hypothetical protein